MMYGSRRLPEMGSSKVLRRPRKSPLHTFRPDGSLAYLYPCSLAAWDRSIRQGGLWLAVAPLFTVAYKLP
jgi:hypothetical protein